MSTKEEIEKLLDAAGVNVCLWSLAIEGTARHIDEERDAAIREAVEAEREACAATIDKVANDYPVGGALMRVLFGAADAIRSRSTK